MNWIQKKSQGVLDSFLMRFFYNPNTVENFFRKKGCMIGKNNRIYITSLGREPYLVKIGNHCNISAGTRLVTHDGGTWVLRQKHPGLDVFGKIELKDNCYIGVNAIIMPGVTIGPNSIIGAGAVVTKDVPANSVAAGVPATVIRTLTEYEKKCVEKFSLYPIQGIPKKKWRPLLIKHFWDQKGLS